MWGKFYICIKDLHPDSGENGYKPLNQCDMATIKFFTRAKKGDKKISNIYLRLRSGKDIDLTVKSGEKIRPDHFNNNSGTVRNIADEELKDEINDKLRDLSAIVLKNLPKNNEEITKDWLENTINRFYNPDQKEKSDTNNLFGFIEDFIAKAPTRPTKTESPACYKQIREYKRTFHYLKEFAKKEKRTIDFKDINSDFYNGFIQYLQGLTLAKEQHMAKNTIGKKIQTLKIFLNAATDEGKNNNFLFKSKSFKAINEPSYNIYLNEDELKRIFELDLSKDLRLDRIRDLFIVGCWTGLRYGDWNKVDKKNIEDGFLEIKQSKTGGEIVIPVHPNVAYILDKYNGNLPRIISDQKMRDYLKEVAKMAGITGEVEKTITRGGLPDTKTLKKWEMVGTHTGRRSFATNMYKMRVQTITIMAITGHKTEASFLKYIKVTPREHAQKMREIWSKHLTKAVN